MHILESYSLNCGAKIDKPFIYKSFFPLPFDKFIILAPNSKVHGKDYNYYQDVINCILPFLEKENIKIIQVGPKDSPVYEGVANLCGQTTINQIAYLVENSILFLGTDGFESQVAGSANVPIVSMNSLTYSKNTGPFFGDKNIQKVFESFKNTGNGKASFNANESPKSINTIKPEEIANAVFEKLNINNKIPFETVFFGEKYTKNIIQESIANHKAIHFHPDGIVEIRTDEDYNEECFFTQLSQYKKAVVVADKEINLNIINQFKQNIQMLVFKITKENSINFLKKVKEIGVKIFLISDLNKEEVNQEKIKYYEFGNINKLNECSEEVINNLKKDIDKLYYRSSKITSSNEKLHYSLAAKQKGVSLNNKIEYQKVIDSPVFWKNLEFFTIVKLNS
tara:strand:+ start:143 stop:1327 length:1185 start_codon:yes stop_codon:yes gene_type:complete